MKRHSAGSTGVIELNSAYWKPIGPPDAPLTTLVVLAVWGVSVVATAAAMPAQPARGPGASSIDMTGRPLS